MNEHSLYLPSLPVDDARLVLALAEERLILAKHTPFDVRTRLVDVTLRGPQRRLADLAVFAATNPGIVDEALAYRINREFAYVAAGEVLPLSPNASLVREERS